MTPGDLLKQLRNELNDRSAPYLWSDAELYSYINAAQIMFTRLTNGIADSQSPVCVIDVVAGDPAVPLDRRILRIRQARYTTDEGTPERRDRYLTLVNPEDVELGTRGYHDDYGPRYGFGFNFERVGRPDYMVVGEDSTYGRLIDIPEKAARIYLVVQRLPLKEIACKDDKFEIAEQHHRYLSYYAQHLAYQKQDAETFDVSRAAKAQEQFAVYCDQAKRENERREHKYRATPFSW